MHNNSFSGIFKSLGLILFLFLFSGVAYGDIRERIRAAVENKNSDEVFSLLKGDSDLEKYKDAAEAGLFGRVFRWAVREGHQNIVELLLAREVNPNLKRNDGKTALHLAAETKNLELVSLLLRYNADPNIPDNNLKTSLHYAAFSGSSKIVELLLNKGANPGLLDKNRQSPVHIAAVKTDDPTLLKLLLEKGAKLDEADIQGYTPFLLAAVKGNVHSIGFLLDKKVDLKAKTNQGRTALHLAAEQGYHQLAERLLDLGLDPNAPDVNGATPLHRAAAFGKYEVAQVLLSKSADPHISDNLKATSLHYAAVSGDPKIVELFLNKGVHPGVLDMNGQSPVHVAAIKSDNPTLFQLLLEKGAKLDQADNEGMTPFLLAVLNRKVHSIEFLLDKKVDPKARSKQGRTALHLAAERGYPELVERLLDLGLDPNVSDGEGTTALHLAAFFGKDDVVQLLLSKNADPDIADLKGETALHFAAYSGQAESVRHLVNHHANLNLLNKKGNTILDYAMRGKNPNGRVVVGILHEKRTAEGLNVLKNSENLEEFRKNRESMFNKTSECSAYLDQDTKERTIKRFLEILETVGKSLMVKESSDRAFPPLLLEKCARATGICQCCLEEGEIFACPASVVYCFNFKCTSCSIAEAEQLLVNHQMTCEQCRRSVKPQMYAHIPGGDKLPLQFKERMFRTELMKDPKWKFCHTEECLNGVHFEKEAPKYFDCSVCGFKGCLECGKDHHGTCEAHLADRQAMMNLLNQGEKVEMRKLTGFEPDENHPLYLEASDPRLQQNSMKTKYGSIQNENDPHFYDGKYRPCPYCGVVTERADGCNAMHCRSCKKEYHWNHGKTDPVQHDFRFETRQYQLEPGIEPHY